MSFNKKTILILISLLIAVLLTGCDDQAPAPTATLVPTVAEPTQAPEPTAAAEAIEPVTEEAAVETAEEAAAVSEEPAGEAAAETVEEPAEAPEEPAGEAAAETVEEPVEAPEEPAGEAAAETVEEPVEAPEEPAGEAAPETAEVTEEAAAEAEVPAEETEKPAAEAGNEGILASADGVEISADSFVQTATFNRYQYLNMYRQYAQMYSMYGLPLDSLDAEIMQILGEEGRERLGAEVIDQLTYDQVLLQEAESAGLEISDEEVYEQLKSMFNYTDPEPEETGIGGLDSFNVTLEATESDDDKLNAFRSYAQLVLDSNYGGMSLDHLKDNAKSILIEDKLFDMELENRVFEAEMVNARHILVETEETAKEILSKLEAGEDWAALASEYSLDTANKDKSGNLGWFGRGQMVPEFEEAAFALEPGEISEPVKTNFGYHIIASDGKEVRPLTDNALEDAKNAAYEEWRMAMVAKHDIQSYPEVWMELVPMEPAFTPSTSAAPEEPAAEPEAVTAEGTEEAVEEPEAVVTEVTEETVEEPEAIVAESTEETVEGPEAAVTEVTEETVEEPEAAADVTEETAEEPEAIVAEGTEEAVEEPEAVVTEVTEETVEEPEAAADVTEETAEEPEEKTEVVLTVAGSDVTADEFKKMAVFNRYQILMSYNQYAQYYAMFGLPLDDVNAYYEGLMGEEGKTELGESTISQLAYFRRLDKEAAEMGIEVTDEDAVAHMKTLFNTEETNTEALPDDEFRALVEMDLSLAFNDEISFDFYRDYVRHGLEKNAVMAKLLEDRVFEGEMVNARHILVEDEDTAKEVLAKLENGEDWAALASEYSIDTGNKDDSGNLGWFGRDVMVDEFEEAAFAMEPGQISEPVQTNFGWHIIALDGKEVRPLENEALQAAQNEVYDEWYDGLSEKYPEESYPDVWMPIIPMEPAFKPVEIDASDENMPTFYEIPNEDTETAEGDEEELTIDNTELIVDEVVPENPEVTEPEEELTISNTEQIDGLFTLNNDGENK